MCKVQPASRGDGARGAEGGRIQQHDDKARVRGEARLRGVCARPGPRRYGEQIDYLLHARAEVCSYYAALLIEDEMLLDGLTNSSAYPAAIRGRQSLCRQLTS